jgi:hypothetical protein
LLLALAGAGLAAPAFVLAQPAAARKAPAHAHAHGAARLNVTIDAQSVTIALESPIDNFVGFERPPRTPAETAALEALQARMRSPGDLFRFDPAAACTLVAATAESSLFRRPAAGGHTGEHADLEASFEFRCSAPGKPSALEVGLFEAYPRLQRLDVVVAAPNGQFKRSLRRPDRSLSLQR